MSNNLTEGIIENIRLAAEKYQWQGVTVIDGVLLFDGDEIKTWSHIKQLIDDNCKNNDVVNYLYIEYLQEIESTKEHICFLKSELIVARNEYDFTGVKMFEELLAFAEDYMCKLRQKIRTL